MNIIDEMQLLEGGLKIAEKDKDDMKIADIEIYLEHVYKHIMNNLKTETK